MLYDNAQLARVYLHWWRLTGSATGRRIALETCDWMVAGLGTPEGGFASALDADTEGVEGSTYVWTPAQLVDVLGEDDGRWAADLLGVVPDGTFEHGTSTLRLLRDPWSDGEADGDGDRWEALRARLLAARASRPQPGRDDKVVLAWNGLAVAALPRPVRCSAVPIWSRRRSAAPTCWSRCTSTTTVAGTGSPATAPAAPPVRCSRTSATSRKGSSSWPASRARPPGPRSLWGSSTRCSTSSPTTRASSSTPRGPRLIPGSARSDVRPTRPTTPTRAGRPQPPVRS